MGVASASVTVKSVTCPAAASLALPGGSTGPTKIATSGVAISEATIQIVRKRRRWSGWAGSGSPPAGGGASLGVALDDIDVAVHVAQRLHRAAEAEVSAGRARDEALPAVAPLL